MCNMCYIVYMRNICYIVYFFDFVEVIGYILVNGIADIIIFFLFFYKWNERFFKYV